MVQPEKVLLSFYGGAETVTGANFVLSGPSAETPLLAVDCGLFQGSRIADKKNREPFPYLPPSLGALLVTHAHLDHIGRIPQLVRAGFRGRIFSTPPTKELAELSLIDSLGVLEKEARSGGEPPWYETEDVAAAMRLWETAPYRKPFALGGWTVTFRDAGHILGSAMVEIALGGRKFVFTGDLGNSPNPLLNDTEAIADADYLVMESVYGDRNHPSRESSRAGLEDVIEESVSRGGTLMIPAFSIERTQAMLYEIEQMMEASRIPLVPVFLDSPLAINVTAVYKKYLEYLKPAAAAGGRLVDGLFNFPQLIKCPTTADSRTIDRMVSPKIIIAGSGMSNGGRIIHHEKRYLPDPTSALLLVGFQAAGSLGRLLRDGATTVKILGEKVPVRAKILSLSGWSAHKGSDDLLEFVRQTADRLRQVWVTMGEPRASLYLAQKLRDHLGVQAAVPRTGQTVEILLD